MGWLRTSNRVLHDWEQLVDELEAHNGALGIGLPGAFERDVDAPDENDENHPVNAPRPWRVRLLARRHDQWIIERPPIVGRRTGGLIPGVTLIGVVIKGAKRWSFRTSILRSELFELNARNRVPALRLSPPRDIGNAQRRRFYRVSTIGGDVPPVNLWPLLEAQSCIAAENANQLRHLDESLLAGVDTHSPPVLGDGFVANMVDVSAGGAALTVARSHAKVFEKHDLFWMELMLATNDHPLVVAATPVHVRIDRPAASVNVGMSFTHEHHPDYRRFVQENLCRYVAWQQRRLLKRNARR